MTVEEMKSALTEKFEAFDQKLVGFAKKDEITAELTELKDAIQALSDDKVQETVAELEKTIEALGLKYEAMNVGAVSAVLSPSAELDSKKDEIKALANKLTAGEINITAALTTRAAVTDSEKAYDLPDIGQLAHAKLNMYDVLPKLFVNDKNDNGQVRYYDWDDATKVRAAAMVAEGAAFPESTAKWQKYTIDMKKIGDSMPVTEEFFEDSALFAAELGMFLETNIKIVRNAQLAVGDGTGQNLTGLYTSAPTYTAVASGITDANVFDLIVKMKESVNTLYGSKYVYNVAFAPASVINQMKLKKDANNNYVRPDYAVQNINGTWVVDGVFIIEENDIAANTLVMGDQRYARIYEKVGIQFAKGEVNNQFLEDEMTLKVRNRLLLLVRNVDKTGWLKSTDVAADLVTLASLNG